MTALWHRSGTNNAYHLTGAGDSRFRSMWRDDTKSRNDICEAFDLKPNVIARFARQRKLSKKPYTRRVVKKPPPKQMMPRDTRIRQTEAWPDMTFTDHPKTVTHRRTGVRYVAGEG